MRQAAESGTPWIGNAEIPILTSGMYIRCCRILAQTEELVGDPSRSQYYRQLADSLSRRLTERYFLPPHERAEYSQTALAFAYYYCDPTLLPREKIVEKLVALCDEGHCFDAGIFGTAPMLHILAAEGYGDIARRLLTKPEYPSYRAMLDLGATTLWEHWPVQGFDGGYEAYDGSMSHPMHAAFDEWLYTGVAGLAARGSVREPWTFRWSDFPELNRASAARRIPEGRISSEWRRDGNSIVWKVEVPAGIEAQVVIPARAGEIREGGRSIADRAETGRIRILPAASASGKQQLSVGSGNYEFSFPAPGANS